MAGDLGAGRRREALVSHVGDHSDHGERGCVRCIEGRFEALMQGSVRPGRARSRLVHDDVHGSDAEDSPSIA
jgi:hypothetical protein